jgi:hypothetical protein
LSTTGNISFGKLFVTGKKRVRDRGGDDGLRDGAHGRDATRSSSSLSVTAGHRRDRCRAPPRARRRRLSHDARRAPRTTASSATTHHDSPVSATATGNAITTTSDATDALADARDQTPHDARTDQDPRIEHEQHARRVATPGRP